jgi:transcriptional regulator with XRE-family HTH domain
MNAIEKRKITIRTKIKVAMDGRKQRWLAQKLGILEPYLSNKLNGITEFSDEELKRISEILNIDLSFKS